MWIISSKLKTNCYEYNRDVSKRPYCDLCHKISVKDAEHVIMHCPALLEIRNQLYYDIDKYEQLISISTLTRNEKLFFMLIGNPPENCDKVHYFEI